MSVAPPQQTTPTKSIRAELEACLALQREAYSAHPIPTHEERKADLRNLQRFVRENKEAIVMAINADYGHRSRHETLFAEIFPPIDGMEHALKSSQEMDEAATAGSRSSAIFSAQEIA